MGRKFYGMFAALALFACGKETAEKVFFEGPTTAKYLANEGIMITRGETKILFDPLFNETYGQYMPLPLDMREALLAGTAPYDDIDAVFVSHSHDDHFSAADMLTLMQSNPQAILIAPKQAVDSMQEITEASDTLYKRVRTIELQYKDKPLSMLINNIKIEAVRIPHSGWPEPSRAAIENISFRITLDEKVTVVHMGDADVNDEHFVQDEGYWAQGRVDMAFPPYWFMQSDTGRMILNDRIRAETSIGTHVPAIIAPHDNQRTSPAFKGLDLFIIPGDERLVAEE